MLTTHEAAALLGYTHDYIARMCREKRIQGLRRGPQWVVEREELDRFAREHEERLAQSRAEVAATRRTERSGVQETRMSVAHTRPVSLRRTGSRVMQELVAVSMALTVVSGSVAFAESGALRALAVSTQSTALAAADGFRESLGAYVGDVRESAARSTYASTAMLPVAAGYAAPLMPSVPAMPRSEAYAFSYATERFGTAAASRGGTALEWTLPTVGEAALSTGIFIRDGLRAASHSAFAAALASGAYFAQVPDQLLVVHEHAIQAFVDLPAPLAQSVVRSVFAIGETVGGIAASVPQASIYAYHSSIKALANVGPSALTKGVEAEIAFGNALVGASHGTARMALEPAVRTVALAPRVVRGAAYAGEEARIALTEALGAQEALIGAIQSVRGSDVAMLAQEAFRATYEPMLAVLGSVGSLAALPFAREPVATDDDYATPIGVSSASIEKADGRGLITAPGGGEYLWAGSTSEKDTKNRAKAATLEARELERAAKNGASLLLLDGSELQIEPLVAEDDQEGVARPSSWLGDTVDFITGAMDREGAERVCIEDRCYSKSDVEKLLKEVEKQSKTSE